MVRKFVREIPWVLLAIGTCGTLTVLFSNDRREQEMAAWTALAMLGAVVLFLAAAGVRYLWKRH